MNFDELIGGPQSVGGNPLKELALRYGMETDKETQHKYCDFYHHHLQHMKDTAEEVLEVGVWMGGSAKMWEGYFTKAKITGIDIESKVHLQTERFKTFLCDQSDAYGLSQIVGDRKYDLIIDDGSHRLRHQQITFSILMFSVKPGGIYILEDLHTSFMPAYRDSDCSITTYDMLQEIHHGMVPNSSYIPAPCMEQLCSMIEWIEFYQRDPLLFTDSITSVIKIKDE
jgi:hypothetical protein